MTSPDRRPGGGTGPDAVDPPPFDLAGELPGAGVTVIESSAGTGKTWTITSLMARYVAAGVPLPKLLCITFTRMATGELRDRVRRRLVDAQAALGALLDAGAPVADDDALLKVLAEGDRTAVEGRRRLLETALSDFDAATIATTHGFCQLVLDGLGSAGDVGTRCTLLEDPAEMVGEVIDDFFVRWSLNHRANPGFTRAQARRAVAAAVANPGVALCAPAVDGPTGRLFRMVERAGTELARRLQDANLVTYDQLLSRLAEILESPGRGEVACGRLRSRYEVVLVDEFQDTDPVQWRVVRRAFGESPTTSVVLVGDPKQAIYSFRGADVHAYLDAARLGQVRSLGVNWRSDQTLLDATEGLLRPLRMGHDDIVFRSVGAAPGRDQPGVKDLPSAEPLRFRLVAHDQPGITRTAAKGLLQKSALVKWVAADVGRDVAAVLAGGAQIAEDGGDRRVWRSVRPADIAVLTRTNSQSTEVRDALRARGVAAVVAGLDSVFTTTAAAHWLTLLEALEEPASRGRMVALALTPWVGLSAQQADAAGEEIWEGIHGRAARWAGLLSRRGVASMYRAVVAEEGLPARLLAEEVGVRQLTDLGHVAELLHHESAGSQLGLATLRNWLARRIDEGYDELAGGDERTRRLDSDAEAVQVLTVHRAKGLEFGIVYCPYLWDAGRRPQRKEPVIFHDRATGRRTLDVGFDPQVPSEEKRYDEHFDLSVEEQEGEELRLMYVALTRARHQVVLWWGRADRCQHSPLGRLLLDRDGTTGRLRRPRGTAPGDREITTAIKEVIGRAAPGLIAFEPAQNADTGPGASVGGGGDPAPLAAARFLRPLDEGWRRASYSSITAAAHARHEGPAVGSEPEDPGITDEPAGPSASPIGSAAPARPPGFPSPLASLPGGAEVGTAVHAVLGEVDFVAADLEQQLATAMSLPVAAAVAGSEHTLAAGLMAVVETPLGPLLPGVALRDVGRADRLDELVFELPLAGGDRPSGAVGPADIAAVLDRHLAQSGPLRGYPRRLDDPLLATDLRGYLTGSIDLVIRRPHPDGGWRWYLADYKTNWLAGAGEELDCWHYRLEALDAEMQRRHYPLQALLYLVALHRYLRWRQPGYDPREHLGGIIYLFLRGMAGPGAPVEAGHPSGVWSWAPPADMVVELSGLFDRGAPTAATGAGRG